MSGWKMGAFPEPKKTVPHAIRGPGKKKEEDPLDPPDVELILLNLVRVAKERGQGKPPA